MNRGSGSLMSSMFVFPLPSASWGTLSAWVLICGLLFGSPVASGYDISFWAWQRPRPLSKAECEELCEQGIRTVYWQIGELENEGETWRWKARFAPPEGSCPLRFVPVVRLESRERSPFSAPSLESLIGMLSNAVEGVDELQLDYDAPDRLVDEYAAALRKMRSHVSKLTITALPGWSRPSMLRALQDSVDELFPMLYDYEPDPIVEGARPIPLLAEEKVKGLLANWNQCKIAWRVGLPSFARLTLFDRSGKSHGHIREWTWDDLCFNQSFIALRPTVDGLTILRARKSGRIAKTRVLPERLLAVRWPDRAALNRVVAQARETSARGTVFFRLPDSTAPSGWSVRQLTHLEARPRLVLRLADTLSELELVNDSDADLEPRLDSGSNGDEWGRGYAVEIDAGAAIVRDAVEGDFLGVDAYVEHDRIRERVSIPLATHFLFAFSHVRARESLRTGPIQLAPGSTFSQIRYRILGLGRESEWNDVDK